MIFMPPRHGKSEMATVRYPVWRLTQDPTLRVIVAAYNQILANKFSRKSRRIAERCLDLSKDRLAVEDWETAQGGGIRAVGVGGGITGQGGNLVIIDDPVKNREQAESEAYRESCWDWYTDDLYTRLEPGAAIILIITRWHEDDLAGRILASEDGPNWTVVSLPAEAEEGDPLGRAVGEALCPDRYVVSQLEEIRKVLGTWAFQALYQQKPTAAEGNLFKRAWFAGKYIDAIPVKAQWIRYWELAATAGGGDFTAGMLMGITPDKNIILADMARGQWGPGENERTRLAIAETDRQKHGMALQIWQEQEGGASGKTLSHVESKVFSGYTIHFDHPTESKAVRAGPFAAQCEAGNVYLVRAPWNTALINELCSFPAGKHDDQVDAASGAYNQLAIGGGWARGAAG